MSYMNKVYLLGRLTRDPDLRGTHSGTSVCKLGLAVSRKFIIDGQEQEEICFVDVVTYKKSAENCGKFLSKGSQVLIEGRLTLDRWEEKQTGEKRSKIIITAENIQFIGGKRDNEESRSNGGGYQRQQQQQSRRVDNDYAPPPQMQDNGEDDTIPF